MIKTYNGRFVPKGDTEANWNKAVGFIPLDKEIIIYKKDANHSAPRIKIGDGVTIVQKLPFISSGGGEVDLSIIQSMIDEKGEILIEYVDNAVAAIPEIQDKIAELEGIITTITFGIQSTNQTITLQNLVDMIKIDWGDGTVNNELTHIYVTAGEYACKIYGVTSIGNEAFYDCDSLMSVVIGNSVANIGNGAFHSCINLTNVEIGDGVMSIGGEAFSGCSGLTSIEIPDSVTWIHVSAFKGCGLIGNVVIPDSVIALDTDSFSCDQLTSITLKRKEPPSFGSYTGVMSDNFQAIYVPYGCGAAYRIKWSENIAPQTVLRKIKESDREAMMSDLDAVKVSIPTNIENSVKMGTIQQVADNGYEEGFNFSGKNTNAEALDVSLSAVQPYGATGKYAVSLGGATSAQGSRSIAINNKTIAKGDESFAQGYCSVALGGSSVATGNATTAAGQGACAGGIHTVALGDGSYAIGYHSIAKGLYSHAQGSNTQANKQSAHAEGGDTVADGEYSHAEGGNTQAIGMYAHSEGVNTLASNRCAHAQGHATVASGDGSHAQGNYTIAEGNYSHAGGSFTRAGQDYQTVIGKFNDNKTNTLFEIGNGLTEDDIDIDGNIIIKNRSNAFEVLIDGRAKVYGSAVENDDVVNKKYVDDGFVGKVTTTGASRAYVVLGNGTQGTVNYNGYTPLADWIACWYDGGVMRMNDPIGNLDGVNKQYAEANFIAKDKVSSNGVYGKSAGNEILYSVSQWGAGGGEDTIARRTSKGGLRVALDETNDKPEEMATPRGWVENTFVAKPTGSGAIYSDGAGNFSTRSIVSGEPKPWTIVERTYEGRVKVGTPTENNDATTKSYVDEAIANLSGGGSGTQLYKHALTITIQGAPTFEGPTDTTTTITFLSPKSTAYSGVMSDILKDGAAGNVAGLAFDYKLVMGLEFTVLQNFIYLFYIVDQTIGMYEFTIISDDVIAI